MRQRRAGRRLLRAAVIWLLTVVLSPLILVAGESVRRYILARPSARQTRPRRNRVMRRSVTGRRIVRSPNDRRANVQDSWRRRRFLMLWVTNPLWIALTAPARWLLDRTARLRPRPPRQPPAAGVREPRRPPSGPPSASVALAEPRAEPVITRLLETARLARRRGDGEQLGTEGRRRRMGGRWRRKPAH